MRIITNERANFLVDFISPDILGFVKERLDAKGLQFPTELTQFESVYQTQMEKFHKKIFSGEEYSLPPSNLIGLALNEVRQVDLKKALMNNLLATICFDQDNNILVKYTVDQGESLEEWAEKNRVDPQNLKSMLDSYFLEFFNEKGLQIIDGKLFQSSNNQLVTKDGFNDLLKDSTDLKNKLTLSGLTKEIDINTENLDQSIENLVKNLNI
jgi:hypothetical protein